MARERGAEFVTGKEVGAEDMVIALEEVGGVCFARQVDMLFTGWVSEDDGEECGDVLRTTLWHEVGGQSWRALTKRGAAR